MHRQRDFPLICNVGGSGGNACLGAKCRSGRTGGDHRSAKHYLWPGSLPLVGQYARSRLTPAGSRTGSRAEQDAPEASG
jgi:hypothetical protein